LWSIKSDSGEKDITWGKGKVEQNGGGTIDERAQITGLQDREEREGMGPERRACREKKKPTGRGIEKPSRSKRAAFADEKLAI